MSPEEITLVAITKHVEAAAIMEAITAGVRDTGENKVLEAVRKRPEVTASGGPASGVKWHMVGHLQTNKAGKAVETFDLIQSLDSLRLAEEIDKRAGKSNKTQDCLVEIKVSSEPAKTGLEISGLHAFLDAVSRLNNIRITGLMTMAPLVDDPEKARPYFRLAREAFSKVTGGRPHLKYLSMGMSGDFEVAIEEGSNMVRIGTAVFGHRAAGGTC